MKTKTISLRAVLFVMSVLFIICLTACSKTEVPVETEDVLQDMSAAEENDNVVYETIVIDGEEYEVKIIDGVIYYSCDHLPPRKEFSSPVIIKEEPEWGPEPEVTPDMITGKIITGVPQDITTAPWNCVVFSNLTEEGVDVEVPVRLAFKWDDLKNVQPGDGIQLDDKLILVENVTGPEITGSEDFLGINGGRYYLCRSPGGYHMNEEDGVLFHDVYYPAKTIVSTHIDFNKQVDFGYVGTIISKSEFIEKLAGKKFVGVLLIKEKYIDISLGNEADIIPE